MNTRLSACSFRCAFMHMCMLAQVDQKSASYVSLKHSLPYVVRQPLSWSSTTELDWLATESLGSACLHVPGWGYRHNTLYLSFHAKAKDPNSGLRSQITSSFTHQAMSPAFITVYFPDCRCDVTCCLKRQSPCYQHQDGQDLQTLSQ